MPLLATFISSLFGSLVVFFGKYLAKRLATTVAGIAVLGTAWVAMFVGIKAIVAGITFVLPPLASKVVALVMPNQFALIITAYFTGMIAINGYRAFKERLTSSPYTSINNWG